MSDTARPVVVGVDGSDAAMDAAKWAAAVAEHREHATAILKSTEEEVRAAFGGLDVFTLRSDEPVDELLCTRSRTAQLVVLGSDEVYPGGRIVDRLDNACRHGTFGVPRDRVARGNAMPTRPAHRARRRRRSNRSGRIQGRFRVRGPIRGGAQRRPRVVSVPPTGGSSTAAPHAPASQ